MESIPRDGPKPRNTHPELWWGLADTPLGLCSVGWTDRGICHLAFQNTVNRRNPPRELLVHWRWADRIRADAAAQEQVDAIFGLKPAVVTPFRALVRGTPFQLDVWRALLRTRPGTLTSYGRIARLIGRPHAARAVGIACGQNPIAVLIPCHRVIPGTGDVGGYRWGTARKQALIAWEATRL